MLWTSGSKLVWNYITNDSFKEGFLLVLFVSECWDFLFLVMCMSLVF